jgi:hypothetical protein
VIIIRSSRVFVLRMRSVAKPGMLLFAGVAKELPHTLAALQWRPRIEGRESDRLLLQGLYDGVGTSSLKDEAFHSILEGIAGKTPMDSFD